MGLSSNLGAPGGPKPAAHPQGTGCRDGSSSQLHQDLSTFSPWAIHEFLTLDLRRSQDIQEHQTNSLETQSGSAIPHSMLWGHFPWTSPMAHAGQ